MWILEALKNQKYCYQLSVPAASDICEVTNLLVEPVKEWDG